MLANQRSATRVGAGHAGVAGAPRPSNTGRPSRSVQASISAWWGPSTSSPQRAVEAFVEERTIKPQTSGRPLAVPGAAEGSAAKQGKAALTLSWAGAGIFFFWQLGAMKYLSQKYDLTKLPMVGASGGGLVSVLAACGVQADRVLEHAYKLSHDYNIWERPMGLVGVWGRLIEQWLDELLPNDAHERCSGRVTLVVTTLPSLRQVGLSKFKTKKDLIDACMASAHVPVVLDLRLTRSCMGMTCVDGSFPDFFTNQNSELLRCGGGAVVFDYFDDPMLVRRGRMDMLELRTYDEVKHMMQLGYNYAEKLHEDGRFSKFELTEVMLDNAGHVREVHVPIAASGALHDQQVVMLDDDAMEAVHAAHEDIHAMANQQ